MAIRANSIISNYNLISDVKQKEDLLKQLKLLLLSFKSLPPSLEPVNKDEFLIASKI